jgi:hypothetical protein
MNVDAALALKARYEAAKAAAHQAHALHEASRIVQAPYAAREPYRIAARRTEEAADQAIGTLMEAIRPLSRTELDQVAAVL